FLQAAEALGIDRRKMDEHVRAAVFGRDEPEPLRVVEPLHCAVLHDSSNLMVDAGCASGRARRPFAPGEYANTRGRVAITASRFRAPAPGFPRMPRRRWRALRRG